MSQLASPWSITLSEEILSCVLGDIQTDRGNLHVDGSSHVIRLQRTTLWHLGAGSGRRPPHQSRPMHRSKQHPYSIASSASADGRANRKTASQRSLRNQIRCFD